MKVKSTAPRILGFCTGERISPGETKDLGVGKMARRDDKEPQKTKEEVLRADPTFVAFLKRGLLTIVDHAAAPKKAASKKPKSDDGSGDHAAAPK